MPLERQTVGIPFTGGLDTKTDPKQVGPAKLVTLQNGVFTSPKRIKKRNGYTALSRSLVGGGTLSAAASITSYNNELVAMDGLNLYSYDVSGSAWVRKGALTSTTVAQFPIAGAFTPSSALSADTVIHSSGVQCASWIYFANNHRVNYSVIDSTTHQQIIGGTIDTGAGNTPVFVKSLVFGNFFVLLWINAANALQYATINVSTLAVSVAANISVAAPYATSIFDASVVSLSGTQYLAVVFWDGAKNNLVTLDSAFTQTAYNWTDGTAAAMTVFQDAAGTGARVAYITTANLLRTIEFTGFAFGSPSTIDNGFTIGGLTAPVVAGVSSGGNSYIFHSIPTAYSGTNSDSLRGVVLGSAATSLALGIRLEGKPFVYNGRAYVLASFLQPLSSGSPSLQATYFLIDHLGNVAARLLTGNAQPTGNSIYVPVVSEAASIAAGTYTYACLITSIGSTSGTGASTASAAVQAVTFAMAPTDQSFQAVVSGNVLLISGGSLMMYDGMNVVEQGFHIFPETPISTVATPGPTGPDAGTYSYRVVYAWEDNQGNVHRSAPSPSITKITGAKGTITITAPMLRLTAKTSVWIEIYRTISNGTIFYRIAPSTAASYIANDSTQETASFIDALEDNAIQGFIQLYTTGGVLENFPVNPVGQMTLYADRVMALDTSNPYLVQFSKQGAVPAAGVSSPVEFYIGDQLNIDQRGGPITAISTIDNWLVIFKRSSIVVTSGQGPDNTGANNDISSGTLLPADVGCTNAKSIANLPQGIIFQSAKGWYLLDRSLNVHYIGAEVEAYNGQLATSAQLIPTIQQVRFTLNSGVALVYDYQFNQWSVFTNHNAVGATVWNGLYAFIQPDATVLQEAVGAYTDNGASIALSLTTSWLKLAQIGGFQRVRRMIILGDYYSLHTLVVRVAYDYDSTVMQTNSIVATSTPGTFGSGSPFGFDQLFGFQSDDLYRGDVYEWRVDLQQQKCQAIQITLTEQPTLPYGQGLDLSSLSFDVGVKKGTAKMPAGQIVG